MADIDIPRLEAEIQELEALYDRTEDRIDRHGGIDYRNELPAIRQKLEEKRAILARWKGLWSKLKLTAETDDSALAAKLLVEVLLEDDTTEDANDIAASFIEDEVGRFDWLNNWKLISSRENTVDLVQRYLDNYGIQADARHIVAIIDRMTVENPGKWK